MNDLCQHSLTNLYEALALSRASAHRLQHVWRNPPTPLDRNADSTSAYRSLFRPLFRYFGCAISVPCASIPSAILWAFSILFAMASVRAWLSVTSWVYCNDSHF